MVKQINRRYRETKKILELNTITIIFLKSSLNEQNSRIKRSEKIISEPHAGTI